MNISKRGLKNKSTSVYIFFIVLLISTVAFIFKALLVVDVSLTDECHQIATSYRFWLGDAPFVDDWSSEQLHGLVLLPLLSAFKLFNNSNEGIVIFFRLSYLIVKLVIAIWGYNRLKNQIKPINLISGILIWYCSSPYNIDSLTYQVVPIMLLVICLVIIIDRDSKTTEYAIVGIAYSISILCQPFWIISYPIILAYNVYLIIKGTNKDEIKQRAIFFHIGIIVIFISFCTFVFMRASLSDVVHNFSNILNEQDHNLSDSSIYRIIRTQLIIPFALMVLNYRITTIVNLIYILLLAFLPKYRKKISIGIPACLFISVVSIMLQRDSFPMNSFFIPFIWSGIENLFYVTRDKRKKYVCILYLSLLFSVSVALGTNTGILATSASLCLLSVSVCLMMEVDPLLTGSGHYVRFFSTVLFILIISATFYNRIVYTWFGRTIWQDNYTYNISSGPMKHMVTNKELFAKYYNTYDNINDLQLTDNDILFVGTSTPLAYLDAEVEYGTMATPFFELDYERLGRYFSEHPNKKPTVVYYDEIISSDLVKSNSFQDLFFNYHISYYDTCTVLNFCD